MQLHIFAAQRDPDLFFAGMHPVQHLLPLGHVDRAGGEVQDIAHDRGKVALFQHHGRLVQHGDSQVLDAALRAHVAEHGDLFADAVGHGRVHARHDNIGENAHALQFLDGMLGGLTLEFARTGDIGYERDVDEATVLPAHLARDLTNCLQKRLGLDITRRAADLGDDDIGVRRLSDLVDEGLDLVGDVRNDLHRLPEVLAVALLVEDVPVHLARSEVGELVEVLVDEALVVPQVEVGLCAVLGDEHLAVLIGAHRPRVDIDIGIELLRRHFIAPHLEKAAKRCRRNALSKSRDNAARDKDVFRHTCFFPPVKKSVA